MKTIEARIYDEDEQPTDPGTRWVVQQIRRRAVVRELLRIALKLSDEKDPESNAFFEQTHIVIGLGPGSLNINYGSINNR